MYSQARSALRGCFVEFPVPTPFGGGKNSQYWAFRPTILGWDFHSTSFLRSYFTGERQSSQTAMRMAERGAPHSSALPVKKSLHNIKKQKYKYNDKREAPEEVDGWAAGPAGHPQHLPHRASLPIGNTLKKLMPRKVHFPLETFDTHDQTLKGTVQGTKEYPLF